MQAIVRGRLADQGSAATAAPIISTTKKRCTVSVHLFFVMGYWDEQKIFNENFFVRGLLRSNDPKVAVLPATAALS